MRGQALSDMAYNETAHFISGESGANPLSVANEQDCAVFEIKPVIKVLIGSHGSITKTGTGSPMIMFTGKDK